MGIPFRLDLRGIPSLGQLCQRSSQARRVEAYHALKLIFAGMTPYMPIVTSA
jgi:hypothetical protein